MPSWQTEDLNGTYELEDHNHHGIKELHKERKIAESAGVKEWNEREASGKR